MISFNFKNKSVLVTGGSKGIGNAISKAFFNSGANVYFTSRAKGKIIQKKNNFLKSIQVDFNDNESCENFFEKINSIKKIDILINNAGMNKIDYVQNIDDKDWENILNLNLSIPFKLTRLISKKMINNKYGRIVNIGSIFSSISKEKRASYSSSKFGLIGLTKSSAHDLANRGILVNAVSPGFVKTNLTKKILSANEIRKLSSTIPLKRMAGPKEITSCVLFLSSSENTYITGQNIIIDGGFSSK
jgi:3-oxoacyl-[acyl-carrier protein] reductase